MFSTFIYESVLLVSKASQEISLGCSETWETQSAGSHVTVQLSATHSLGWEPHKDPTSCEANSRKH